MRIAASALILTAASLAQQPLGPQMRHSTHDWTEPAAPPSTDLAEAWADVKSPGDGRQYTVGTIEVQSVNDNSRFSVLPAVPGSNAARATGLPPFGFTGTQVRQVAMLQVTDAAQTIVWQRYFYGRTGVIPNEVFDRATNARAVSVWPAENLLDTRVVICGETFDERLPASQAPNGWPSSTGTNASGFIAVFNGDGVLLWTHHLFGQGGAGECAVTDVSVRVEFEQGVPVRDVITYCGISSFGNPPGGNAFLTPSKPFAAPPGTGCSNLASGSTDNGAGQWDGFVGSIARDHANTLPTSVRFHSVVGGNQQDGLFGISELPDGRFVTVGSTAGGRTGIPAPTGTSEFPFTSGLCLSQSAQWMLGTVLLFAFDDEPDVPPPLELQDAREIGMPGMQSTIARDVFAHVDTLFFNNPDAANTIFVVGSTDDPSLMAISGLAFPPATSFAGVTDGFLLAVFDDQSPRPAPSTLPPPWLNYYFGDFRGGPEEDGLTGVHGWNEFVDQVVVTGFRSTAIPAGGTERDIDVASFYLFGAPPYPAVANQPPPSMRLLTGGQVGGDGFEFPAAMGATEVTNQAVLPFVTATTQATIPPAPPITLGNPAGGGVAQDANGRVNVVGTTVGNPTYPVAGGGRPRSFNVPFAGAQQNVPDAVRTVLDLLPAGVGRTDGTGATVPPPNAPFPLANRDGGTTPPCARLLFGAQLGRPAPPLYRMLIDYEGPPPGGGVTNAALVVVRPPDDVGLGGAALQVGFPGTPGSAQHILLPEGLEIWTAGATTTYFVGQPNASFRLPLGTMPPGPFNFTAQLVLMLQSAIPAGNPTAGIACGGTVQGAASPALWINYP